MAGNLTVNPLTAGLAYHAGNATLVFTGPLTAGTTNLSFEANLTPTNTSLLLASRLDFTFNASLEFTAPEAVSGAEVANVTGNRLHLPRPGGRAP
ncbi:MAG: hypothetical protein QXO51_06970 [Halobacteria archaeon]